jgi:hypothetical protein
MKCLTFPTEGNPKKMASPAESALKPTPDQSAPPPITSKADYSTFNIDYSKYALEVDEALTEYFSALRDYDLNNTLTVNTFLAKSQRLDDLDLPAELINRFKATFYLLQKHEEALNSSRCRFTRPNTVDDIISLKNKNKPLHITDLLNPLMDILFKELYNLNVKNNLQEPLTPTEYHRLIKESYYAFNNSTRQATPTRPQQDKQVDSSPNQLQDMSPIYGSPCSSMGNLPISPQVSGLEIDPNLVTPGKNQKRSPEARVQDTQDNSGGSRARRGQEASKEESIGNPHNSPQGPAMASAPGESSPDPASPKVQYSPPGPVRASGFDPASPGPAQVLQDNSGDSKDRRDQEASKEESISTPNPSPSVPVRVSNSNPETLEAQVKSRYPKARKGLLQKFNNPKLATPDPDSPEDHVQVHKPDELTMLTDSRYSSISGNKNTPSTTDPHDAYSPNLNDNSTNTTPGLGRVIYPDAVSPSPGRQRLTAAEDQDPQSNSGDSNDSTSISPVFKSTYRCNDQGSSSDLNSDSSHNTSSVKQTPEKPEETRYNPPDTPAIPLYYSASSKPNSIYIPCEHDASLADPLREHPLYHNNNSTSSESTNSHSHPSATLGLSTHNQRHPLETHGSPQRSLTSYPSFADITPSYSQTSLLASPTQKKQSPTAWIDDIFKKLCKPFEPIAIAAGPSQSMTSYQQPKHSPLKHSPSILDRRPNPPILNPDPPKIDISQTMKSNQLPKQENEDGILDVLCSAFAPNAVRAYREAKSQHQEPKVNSINTHPRIDQDNSQGRLGWLNNTFTSIAVGKNNGFVPAPDRRGHLVESLYV